MAYVLYNEKNNKFLYEDEETAGMEVEFVGNAVVFKNIDDAFAACKFYNRLTPKWDVFKINLGYVGRD